VFVSGFDMDSIGWIQLGLWIFGFRKAKRLLPPSHPKEKKFRG
jgi:hypothetical protein